MYEECDNFHIYSPSHSGAIVDLHFTHDGSKLVTASTDKTVGLFDTVTCQRIKRFKGHTGFVNSVSPVQSTTGPPLVASASDDCSVKIWDCRRKNPSANLNSTYQVTVSVLTDFLASESCKKINICPTCSLWLLARLLSKSSLLELTILSKFGICGKVSS